MGELFASRDQQRPLVAVVAGSGQVARSAVAARADLLLVLNAGLYRNLGYGSLASFLPYGNANEQTELLLRQHVLPRAGRVPVVAGVFGTDPVTDVVQHLERLRALGVRGVTNWPALGFVDGQYREALEAEGFDTASELNMLIAARARGLATFGFALTEDDVRRFAGVSDGLILNVGLTQQVDDRQDRRDRVQAAIVRLNRMLAAARKINPHLVCLMFGGPVTSAEDFEAVARQSRIDGFAGGSVFERLPVQRAVEALVRQFRGVTLGAAERQPDRLGSLLGHSPAMQQLFDTIRRVAPYDVNVCVAGATGSGKELVAAEIHRLSPRGHEPFVILNCGAIPDTLLESELFGYEKGAFTGADRRRLGKFELADRGTLFLDEVADLSPRAQVALLRAIQQGEVLRVGGDKPIHVNVRIITATHEDLPRCVAQGRFRADLYFRLNQVALRVPSLFERREDIPLLVGELLARLRGRLGRELSGLTPEFQRRLMIYAWPGNVRELEHVICRAAILEDGAELAGHSFLPEPGLPAQFRVVGPGARQVSAELRRRAEEALGRAGGNKSQAAALLGVSRKTLYKWLRAE